MLTQCYAAHKASSLTTGKGKGFEAWLKSRMTPSETYHSIFAETKRLLDSFECKDGHKMMFL